MKNEMKCMRNVVFALVILLLLAPLVNAASGNNISIMYGWNGTAFNPVTLTSTGAIMTDINMSESLGLNPSLNNTYDIGAVAKLWANLYTSSIRSSGLLSIIGDANVTGTFYASSIVANLENATGLTNISVLYGVNNSNPTQQLPVGVDNGALKLTVRQSNIATANSLIAGATGSTLTLSGGLNVTAGGLTVAAGNVGIGTTAPGAKLEINKDSTYNSETAAGIYIKSGGSSTKGLILGADNTNTVSYVQATSIGNSWTSSLALNPMGGNVGIGTTGPATLLHVVQSASGDVVRFDRTSNVDGTVRDLIRFQRSGNTVGGIKASNDTLMLYGSTNLTFGISETEKVRIDANGNVGIGTTAPSYLLDVYKASDVGLRLGTDASNNDVIYFARDGATKFSIIHHGGQDDLYIRNSTGNEIMSFEQNGNVGIGSTAPTNTLSVNGTIRQEVLATGNPTWGASGAWVTVYDFSGATAGYAYRGYVTLQGISTYTSLFTLYKTATGGYTFENHDVNAGLLTTRLNGAVVEVQQNSGTSQTGSGGTYIVYKGISW